MATEEDLDDGQIRRSVGRSLVNWLMVIASLGIIGLWAATSVYTLEPGEVAVILWLGKRDRIVVDPGLKWHVPVPFETLQIVNVAEIREESFGILPAAPAAPMPADGASPEDTATPTTGESRATFANAMQTADSNIVNLGYALQYQIDDSFAYLYGMKNPLQTLFDATRASVREVIGRTTVDDILARKTEIQTSAEDILRVRLADYFGHVDAGSAFEIKAILLQVAQAPAQVQGAFDDVVSAQQDSRRSVSAARGDAREVVEQANARAIELGEGSLAYKEATILEARGRAVRFEALLREYQRAPEVTRRRLYLETMEEVLPDVEKMIIEPGASTVMPLIQLPSGRASSGVSLPSVGAGAALGAGSADTSR